MNTIWQSGTAIMDSASGDEGSTASTTSSGNGGGGHHGGWHGGGGGGHHGGWHGGGRRRRSYRPDCARAERKRRPHRHCGSDAADQQFALVNNLGRQMVVEFDEQLFVADHFLAPGFAIEGLSSSNFSLGKSMPFHSMSS